MSPGSVLPFRGNDILEKRAKAHRMNQFQCEALMHVARKCAAVPG